MPNTDALEIGYELQSPDLRRLNTGCRYLTVDMDRHRGSL